MVTKLNCLSCGHNVDLSEAYDDFEGQIKCFACGCILSIKMQEGKLKSIQFVKMVRPTIEEAIEKTI